MAYTRSAPKGSAAGSARRGGRQAESEDEERRHLLDDDETVAAATGTEEIGDDAPRFDDEILSAEDRRRLYQRSMDGGLMFALLLYVNIFYFALFAGVEFCLLLFKAYAMSDHPKHGYSPSNLINEMVILAFMGAVETVRLLLGNKHELDGFDKNLQNLFRILVLTVPSIYSVAYFTFWQHLVLRLDTVLGSIMLVIQVSQFMSAFYNLFKKHFMPKKRL